MAYSKVSNKNQDKDVKYLSKDFNSFKDQLIEFAQTYYPETYNDFSEGSPGMMFIEMASYVGDVLSFYTDKHYIWCVNLQKNYKNLIFFFSFAANFHTIDFMSRGAEKNYEFKR